MRRSETAAAGWVLIGQPLDAHAVCPVGESSVCASTIPWRVGVTEIQVFGVYQDGNTGEATPVGDRPAYTYR